MSASVTAAPAGAVSVSAILASGQVAFARSPKARKNSCGACLAGVDSLVFACYCELSCAVVASGVSGFGSSMVSVGTDVGGAVMPLNVGVAPGHE